LEEDRDLSQFKKEFNKKEKELNTGKIKEITMMTCIINLRVMKPEEEHLPLQIVLMTKKIMILLMATNPFQLTAEFL
jgi:hypothetical protein